MNKERNRSKNMKNEDKILQKQNENSANYNVLKLIFFFFAFKIALK